MYLYDRLIFWYVCGHQRTLLLFLEHFGYSFGLGLSNWPQAKLRLTFNITNYRKPFVETRLAASSN